MAQSTKGRIGLKQLCEELSLSMCTVSKILNDPKGAGSYRPETVKRVKAAAVKHGYRPDLVAKSLAEGSTRTIGLCFGDIANPFFGQLASAIENHAVKRDYSCVICNSKEDSALEARQVRHLLTRRIDALVITPVGKGNAPLLGEAEAAGCRVVVVDRSFEQRRFSQILVDNRRAMAELTTRCLAQGHRRIGVLAGRRDDGSLAERLAGIREAATKHTDKITITVAKGCTATDAKHGHVGLRDLLNRKQSPTLILSLANLLSVGALQAAREAGVVLGRDIAFASFDDFESACLVDPTITCISQPIADIAKFCSEAALAAAPSKPQHTTLACTLHWRESVPVA